MPELNLVLLGPPGSGKGTQGERLNEDLRLPYYATGDILRAAVRDQTELGRTAKDYMDRGDLVPDEVIVGGRTRISSGPRYKPLGGGQDPLFEPPRVISGSPRSCAS